MLDDAFVTDPPGDFRRASGMTWHICAIDYWNEQQRSYEYEPEKFAQDGFVHCTDDRLRLMEIANLFYRRDLRQYVALEIDLDMVPAPAKYEDAANEFPHVYGRIPVSSVRAVFPIEREKDGTFIRIADETLRP